MKKKSTSMYLVSIWKKYTDVFRRYVEYNLLQSSVSVYLQGVTWESKRILDAGWGSGRSSMMLINTFMQPGAVLYCTDFSHGMIEAFENNLKCSEFKDDKFKYEVVDGVKEINIEENYPENKIKKCYLLVADNGSLPFADESFDTYVSNYCIQYSDNPLLLIKEAYRVLQKGGIFSIALGGRIDNWRWLFVLEDAIRMHNIDIEHTWRIFCLSDKK